MAEKLARKEAPVTIDDIRKLIPGCPDDLAKLVLGSKEPRKKAVEVNEAIGKIVLFSGESREKVLGSIQQQGILPYFVRYTREFLAVARSEKSEYYGAFEFLAEQKATEEFNKKGKPVFALTIHGSRDTRSNTFQDILDCTIKGDLSALDSEYVKFKARNMSDLGVYLFENRDTILKVSDILQQAGLSEDVINRVVANTFIDPFMQLRLPSNQDNVIAAFGVLAEKYPWIIQKIGSEADEVKLQDYTDALIAYVTGKTDLNSLMKELK